MHDSVALQLVDKDFAHYPSAAHLYLKLLIVDFAMLPLFCDSAISGT